MDAREARPGARIPGRAEGDKPQGGITAQVLKITLRSHCARNSARWGSILARGHSLCSQSTT